MINLKKNDPVADAVRGIMEKELKGNQTKLDKNHNGKLDAQDFKILRGQKKATEEVESVEENAFDYKSPRQPEPNGGSGVKKGSRYGGSKQKEKPEQEEPKEKNEQSSYFKDRLIERAMLKMAAKKAFKALTGGSDEDQRKDLQKKMGVPQTGQKPTQKEEVESIEEGLMTGITLGKKVKNDEGGHDQDVHHKGKKIGSISSYSHRTGTRYGMKHDASSDATAGSRSHEEALGDLRQAHAEHLKSMKSEEVESLEEGKMDKMTLSGLWHKHAQHSYWSDQGYGSGTDSPKHSGHAATAIENHVRKHHGNKVADDMVSHSDHHVAYNEYAGPEDAPHHEKEMAKLKKKHGISDKDLHESAPPGFEGTVKAMKKHKDIDNPFALAWSMKNKGYKSHKKADGSDK